MMCKAWTPAFAGVTSYSEKAAQRAAFDILASKEARFDF
jgi:hypothetical protein